MVFKNKEEREKLLIKVFVQCLNKILVVVHLEMTTSMLNI